jgi:Uma2 family endonuclease
MRTLTIDNTKEWAVNDYLLLGEIKRPCQLIDGKLFRSATPHLSHQRISRNLFKIFDRILEGQGETFYAPIDLYIDNKNVFQPDLAYVSNKSKSGITNRGIEGLIEIVVEIISPSNSYTDRNQKKSSYLKFGINEYWIVDPGNKSIEIYSPEGGGEVPIFFLSEDGLVTSPLINKLHFELKDIF